MSYISTIKADTPLHWWRMADGGGNFVHDIGSSPKHAIGGLSGLGYSGPALNGGSAILFDPGGYTVREGIALTDPFSAEVWVWLTEDTPGAAYALLASDGVTGGIGYYLQLTTARKLAANVGASATLTGATTLTTQTWHHCALTHDASNMRIYLDGVQDAILAQGAIANWTKPYGIGEKTNGTNRGNFVFIAEAAHYNGTLASGNVAAHHSAAEQPTQAPIWTGGSVIDPGTGVPGLPLFTSLDDILNSVRKTY